MVSLGPSRAPAAASSLTSPAPVAPKMWPGIMNARPSRQPSSAAPRPTRPKPAAARPMPMAAKVAVRMLGMRRVRRSITAAAPMPTATIAVTRASEFCSNAIPEHRLDSAAQRVDRAQSRDDDERHEQRVLEQVLARVRLRPPPDRLPYAKRAHDSPLARHTCPHYAGTARVSIA